MSTSPSTAHEPLPRFPSAEHDTSDFTAEAGPSKSGRPRIAKACRPCGQQKLRCDGATPCSRCVSLECTDTCVYLPSLRGKTRKKRVDREREAAAKAAAEAEASCHAAAGIDERRSMSRGHVRDEERNTDEHATIPDTGTEWNSEPHRRFWDRSQQLAESGARNSSLWRDKEDAADTGRTVGLDRMEDRGRRRTNSGTAEHPARVSSRGNGTDRTTSPEIQRRKSAAVDKLTTTLPLPGDAHNPLAVLVELSEVTPPVDEDAEGGTSGTSPGGHAVHSGPVRLGHPMIGQAKEEGYYAPLQRTLKDEAPHIMSLINTHEAKQLFDIYFTHLHPHLPFLDKQHSSPGVIARRNNFLFNATRSYNVALWERLKDFARFEMERLPKEKNIDVVQGHLIYTCWNLIRPKRFEQDMTWLRAGIASRTAIDIALHRVGLMSAARQGLPAWLLTSIVRTWLLCFVVDRTLCIQLGKPSGRQWEVEAAKYAALLRGEGRKDKAENGEGPSVDDLLVASLTDWALNLTAAVDAFNTRSLLSTSDAFDSRGASSNLADIYVNQLIRWRRDCTASLSLPSVGGDEAADATKGGKKGSSGKTDPASQLAVYENYGRLVVQSLALQYAMDSAPLQVEVTFAQYQSTAIQLVDTISQTTASLGSRALRGVPDFMHSALTYAATSLLRCTQTRFASLSPDRSRIFEVARQAADLLGEAAIGADHIAAVQSGFVSRLIATRDVVATPASASARVGGLKTSAVKTGAGGTADRQALLAGERNGVTAPAHEQGTAGQIGTAAGVSPDTMFNRPPEAIDFEAFARALNVDQSMTPWPPLPSSGVAGMAMGMGMGINTGLGSGIGMGAATGVHMAGNNTNGAMGSNASYGMTGIPGAGGVQGSGPGSMQMLSGTFAHSSSGAQDAWNGGWHGMPSNSSASDHVFDFGLEPSSNTDATQYQSSGMDIPLGGVDAAGAVNDNHGLAGRGNIQNSNNTSSNMPSGLESWVAQQGLNVSSSGLGPGVGDFIGMGVGDGEGMGFVNEAFWQSVFGGRSM